MNPGPTPGSSAPSGAPPATAPAGAAAPAGRLLVTLGGAGGLAGLLIVLTVRGTLPTIEANRAERLRAAIREVLAAPARADTLYLVNGALSAEPPSGSDRKRLERVFLGYDGQGKRVGFAISAGEPGFADVVTLIFGYDPGAEKVLGMKVLGSKETPGLGDRIEKDSAFVKQFRGIPLPLAGVKAGSANDPGEVDMITGATISSRAVIRIIDRAVARWQPLLLAYREANAR